MTVPDPTPAFVRFRKTGDPEALATLFDATAPELLRVASHLVSDLHAAEDLVQSTFVTAIEHRYRFAADQTVLPWLLGILTNHARRHHARVARRPDPDRVHLPEPRQPDETAAGLELSEAISDAIQRLPDPYRPVLMLHLRHGLLPRDIALDLGRAPATVRKQLQRGLEHLRRSLPAGVASLCVVPSSGLAVMRAAVLHRAAELQPVTLVALGGALLMKKTVVVATSALLLVALWSITPWRIPAGTDEAGVGKAVPLSSVPAARKTNDSPAEVRAAVDMPEHRAKEPHQPPTPVKLTVRGTVVAPKGGRPLPDASIFLSVRHQQDRGKVVTRTDDAGHFVLEDAELGCFVAAFADGWAPCATQIVEGDPGSTQVMHLELMYPGASVLGRVFGPDGRPIAGASIVIGRRGGPGGWHGSKRATSPPPIWLRSDADGRFHTTSAPWRAPVHVRADRLAPWRGAIATAAPGGAPTEIAVRLTLGGVLAGRVLDGAGGGVAKAWVYAGKWNPDEPRWTVQHTTTDDQGRYRITGIPAGSTVVRARCDGRRGVEAALDFVDAAVTEWHPVLRTTPGIRGRILDEHGDELEGYTVRAESADGHMPRKVKSSRDGSFVVRGCERNSYTLRVYHPKDWGGYTVAHRPSVVPDAGECVIRLSAESRALGGVKAVVLHADGRPVGRVQCTLWREPYSGGRNLHSEAGSGKIERQFLPPGRYRLDVRAPNYPLLQRHFTVRPGKTTDLSELRLSLPGTLLVKLRRLDGVPMRRGGLSIVDERNLHVGQIDVFDGVGKSELPGGRYTLISGPDWVPQLKHVIEITPGRETVAHLTARVCAPRTVRFVHPDVDKDLELDITLRARDGRVVFQREGSRWRKRSKFTPQITWRLGPGSYRLELKAGRGYRGAATIEVRKGSSAATIDVVLRRKRLPR